MSEDFFAHKHSKKLLEFTPTVASTDENVLHLLLRHAPFLHPRLVLKRKDLSEAVLGSRDSEGFTPLLRAAHEDNRAAVQRVLASKNVRGWVIFLLKVQLR